MFRSCCIFCNDDDRNQNRNGAVIDVKNNSDSEEDNKKHLVWGFLRSPKTPKTYVKVDEDNRKMSTSRKMEKSDSASSQGNSLHGSLLREVNDDIFEKYEITEVLGQGSMGAVAKVRIKEDKVGGSAFNPKLPDVKGGLFGFGIFKFRRNKKFNPLKKRKPGAADAAEKVSSTETETGSSAGKVSLTSDYLYALKSIQLDRISPEFLEELENEIDILRSMDHPNIVKAHEVYFYKNQIYLVIELCDGGDLYTRAPYSEWESAKMVSQLLSAVQYMHDNGIVHRDLKFENIMFENESPGAAIKVIDFGLSKKFARGRTGIMIERVGTVYTMAPQVLQGIYSSKADLWAIGVITYMLLSSTKPFYHKRRKYMVNLIMRGKYSYDKAPVWDTISKKAKDFIDHLLVVDPKKRYDASKALQHDWIVNRMQLPDEKPSKDLINVVDDSLIGYHHASHLKKLALTVIAHRSTPQEIVDLRKVFEAYDTAGNGLLSFEEFKKALENTSYSEEALEDIFDSIDINQNGVIQYTEFLAATIEAHGHIEEDRLAEAFDRLDADDSGYITRENLKEVLGSQYTKELADTMINDADTNKDGKISYEEFVASFRSQTKAMLTRVAASNASLDAISEESEGELMGLDAKIPGGRFDSGLSESLKKQLDVA